LFDYAHKYYVDNHQKDAAWQEVPKEPPVSGQQKGGSAAEAVWTLPRRDISLALAGIDPPYLGRVNI
jgi:hypothetical protein